MTRPQREAAREGMARRRKSFSFHRSRSQSRGRSRSESEEQRQQGIQNDLREITMHDPRAKKIKGLTWDPADLKFFYNTQTGTNYFFGKRGEASQSKLHELSPLPPPFLAHHLRTRRIRVKSEEEPTSLPVEGVSFNGMTSAALAESQESDHSDSEYDDTEELCEAVKNIFTGETMDVADYIIEHEPHLLVPLPDNFLSMPISKPKEDHDAIQANVIFSGKIIDLTDDGDEFEIMEVIPPAPDSIMGREFERREQLQGLRDDQARLGFTDEELDEIFRIVKQEESGPGEQEKVGKPQQEEVGRPEQQKEEEDKMEVQEEVGRQEQQKEMGRQEQQKEMGRQQQKEEEDRMEVQEEERRPEQQEEVGRPEQQEEVGRPEQQEREEDRMQVQEEEHRPDLQEEESRSEMQEELAGQEREEEEQAVEAMVVSTQPSEQQTADVSRSSGSTLEDSIVLNSDDGDEEGARAKAFTTRAGRPRSSSVLVNRFRDEAEAEEAERRQQEQLEAARLAVILEERRKIIEQEKLLYPAPIAPDISMAAEELESLQLTEDSASERGNTVDELAQASSPAPPDMPIPTPPSQPSLQPQSTPPEMSTPTPPPQPSLQPQSTPASKPMAPIPMPSMSVRRFRGLPQKKASDQSKK
ncbi:uncharacterized protein FA14DRAFT_161877 [Meira miltonrushii]|uniref:Uncharacterized protein n=1 Tax=Meira miltonrushii TaxID=1280837 RepID=A0A316V4F3_9BASI|nr:uncharacterized protein FA14DRAFT_161877 [Meira miltonrushii]PWN32439.1 hypothetical protein FA14DRAFT_161877 [Meira miltonrushii]